MKMLYLFPCLVGLLPAGTPPTSLAAGDPARSGVYLTGRDFLEGRLALASVSKTVRCKIRLNQLLNRPYITVVHNNDKYYYLKQNIFGVRTSGGTDYRLNEGRNYEVVSPGPILLYRTQEMVPGKGQTILMLYYFSTSPEAPVLPLTRRQLQRAYAHEPGFLSQVGKSFPNDAALASYDARHARYRLSYVFEKATSRAL